MSTPTISKLSGTGYRQLNLPTKSPEQMDMFRQLMGGSQGAIGPALGQMSSLAGGGDEETWRQLEAPAMRQFGELQGGMASRFSGMGGGARRSSGFQNSMGSAGVDLAERLQGQRMGLQQSAQQQLMQLYQSLMGENLSENTLIPKQKSGWEKLLEGLGGIGGSFAGTMGGYGLGKKFFG